MKNHDDEKMLESLKNVPAADARAASRHEEQTWTQWQERNSNGTKIKKVLVVAALLVACSSIFVFTANAMGGDHWFQDFCQDFHAKLYEFHQWMFGK